MVNKAAKQVIAKDGETVVGYALVMLKSFADMIPVLKPLFDRLNSVRYGHGKITDYSFSFTRNKRSMRAHLRVGFITVNTFRDATDERNVLVCNLST